MKVSRQSKREAKVLFRSLQANGGLDENKLRRAVQLLGEQKPRGYLGILSHLQHLVKLDIKRRTARIDTAAPLGAEIEEKVKNTLARRYGAALAYSFHTNPALLGGMRIRVGSDVYDGTVSGRLRQLEESLGE
jgi:F-type H+-transporting ATPase subunit delta